MNKIAIIDDCNSILRWFRQVLGKRFEVSTFKSGEEGYDALKFAYEAGCPYQVCFVDLFMPGWNGLDTGGKIREFDLDIFLVVITGGKNICIGDITDSLGISKLLYCRKPLRKEEIFQICNCMVEQWHINKRNREDHSVLSRAIEVIIQHEKNKINGNLNIITEVNKNDGR